MFSAGKNPVFELIEDDVLEEVFPYIKEAEERFSEFERTVEDESRWKLYGVKN